MTSYLDSTKVDPAKCHVCHGSGHDPDFGSVCGNCTTNQGPGAAPSMESTPPGSPDASAGHVQTKKESPMGFWDNEDIEKAANQGSYAKWLEAGDTHGGVIEELGERVFDEGKESERLAVEITFADGSKATCGQVKLMQALLELKPEVGETLTIELVEVRKIGSKTLKFWRVNVKPIGRGKAREIDQSEES